MDKYKEAMSLEHLGKWREAAQVWISMGRKKEADACMLLADSIEAGDAYREEVDKTIGEEPELTHLTINEWKKWHEDLRLIYNKHFK